MSGLLLILHPLPDGSLSKSARETVTVAQTTAQALGMPWCIGLSGSATQKAADALAGTGAASILAVAGADFDVPRYASDAAAAEALARQSGAEIVLAPASARFSRCLAGVAQRLGGRIDTHITGLEVNGGTLRARRWYYRQRMEAVFSRAHRPWFLLIDGGIATPWQGPAGQAAVTAVAVTLADDSRRTTVVGLQAPASDAQTIRPDANVLFVAGAGWTKKQADGQPHVGEAATLIRGFLGKAQASLGSSKSLVDLKTEGQQTLDFMSHLNQVGQTGSTPRHPKGLSTCCHGEEPHVVGWRFIGERRAINLDPNCGWAQGKADVVYVADAFEVMRNVNAMLGAS
ncbi:MAG: electron transfer flavoprotein subunit alpha [Lentisphaerae bacterium]|nr:electron transfer flavoprotein subunit alpha [Lentisphaerota bacterium]